MEVENNRRFVLKLDFFPSLIATFSKNQPKNEMTTLEMRLKVLKFVCAGLFSEEPRVPPTFSSTKGFAWRSWPGTMPSPGT